MAGKRYLSKWRSFFWLLVVVAVCFYTRDRFEQADVYLYNTAAELLGQKPEERILHLLHPGQTAPNEADEQFETRRTEYPLVGTIEVDTQSATNCFAALPLGPQDMAVLLQKLAEQGVKHLGVSAPLSWEGKSSAIARQMVCLGLQHFDHAVVGLRGRTAADADFTPTVLRSFVIPSTQIEGDATGLPAANRAIENELMQAAEAQELCWAPDWLDDERLTTQPQTANERSYPLLMRWNGEVIPTLPLRLALLIKGYSAADIHVKPGKEIRLGKEVLPLDEHGRTRLQAPQTTAIRLADVVDGQAAPPSAGSPTIALLTQPIDGTPESRRPAQIAATISQLCGTEIVEQHVRPGAPGLSLMRYVPRAGWLNVSLLALTALFAVRLLPFLPGILRKLFMLALLAGIFWFAYELQLRGKWFHISNAVLTWGALAVALCFLHPVNSRKSRRR